jgi:SNW domain-containing protein 1
MLAEDFGDGGAFAEIHIPQYPLGLGRRVPASVNATGPTATTTEFSSRLFESALVVKSAGAELIGASPEDIQNNVQRTREALQRALEQQTSTVGNHSQRSDPLDPRMKKPAPVVPLTSSALVVQADPAPIVRSPPKKARTKEEEASEKELSSVPFCVSSWTNKKNLVIALEDRVASAHEETEGPKLGDNHIKLAMALSRAKKDVVQQHTLEAKMEREAQEKQQAEVEGSALKDAQALLEAMEQQRTAQQATESREERQNRLRLEREQRERERAVKAKLRRHQEAAARLGITVEALEADAELLRSIDSGAVGRDGDDLSELVDARVIQEASRKQDDGSTDSIATQKALHVSTRGIENEMKILDAAAAAEPSVSKRPRTGETDSDDSDDDLFGVADILQQPKGGRRL